MWSSANNVLEPPQHSNPQNDDDKWKTSLLLMVTVCNGKMAWHFLVGLQEI